MQRLIQVAYAIPVAAMLLTSPAVADAGFEKLAINTGQKVLMVPIAEYLYESEALSFQDKQDVTCLALTIYFEGRDKRLTEDVRWMIAYVAKNRLESSAYGSTSYCPLVWKPGTYSWTADVPKMKLHDRIEADAWLDAQAKAYLIFIGLNKYPDITNKATHFDTVANIKKHRKSHWARYGFDPVFVGPFVFMKVDETRHRKGTVMASIH